MISWGLKSIENYPVMGDVFNGVSVCVSIFLMERGYTGKTEYVEKKNNKITYNYAYDFSTIPIIPRSEYAASILHKAKERVTNINNFGMHTLPDECFRVNSNGNVGRGPKTYALIGSSIPTDQYNVAVYYMDTDKSIYTEYIAECEVPNRVGLVNTYKVICGARFAKNSNVISNLQVIDPPSVTSASWGVLYCATTRQEAENVAKYVRTKFFRFLLKLSCGDGLISISSYRFQFVPNLDFSENSKIDWSLPVDQLDKILYAALGLTTDEIKYIEDHIDYIK
jgi:site-specific DNA-methyltransferase (adenine-specific)